MSDSTIINGNKSFQEKAADVVLKQGILGVLLIALIFYIWVNDKYNREDRKSLNIVLEKNTEVISKNSIIVDKAAAIGEKTVSALEKVERKLRRSNE